MKKKLYYLDGLKTILSLSIVLFHYSAMFDHEPAKLPFSSFPQFADIIRRGNYAVEIFFIISGFLIAYNYKEKIRQISFFSFLKKRLHFLYWSAFFSVILGIVSRLLAIWVLDWENNLNFWDILLSLTLTSHGYLQGKWPYGTTSWYIGILVLCYFIYYIISKISIRKPHMYFPLCIALIIVGWVCIYKFISFPFLYYNSAARGYCCFFTGVLMYDFQNSKIFNKKALAYTGLTVFAFFALITFHLGYKSTWGRFNLAMPVFIAPTIFLATLNIENIQKILSIKPLYIISKINTALYLTHVSTMSILWTINVHFKLGFQSDDPLYLYINILVCYITAYIWHLLVDKRFIPKFVVFIKKIYLNHEET